MTNRYKYPLANTLINRLSGYSSSGQRGSSSSRKMFLKRNFPNAFRTTQENILDPKTLENLPDNPRRQHLFEKKNVRLVKKFRPHNTEEFLGEHWPKFNLQKTRLQRLKQLCNAIQDKIKNKTCSRLLDHFYTQILACLVTSKSTTTMPKVTLSQFQESGWAFSEKRFTSARKRQREETFTDLKPSKRGRVEISDELKKKIRQEQLKNARAGANLTV